MSPSRPELNAVVFIVFSGVWSAGFAQSGKEQEIVTDRPDITESSTVVPAGSLVVENGLTWTRDHGKSFVDMSESLVRFGLRGRTELRFDVPCYFYNLGGRGRTSGFNDTSVGIKEQIGPLPGGIDLAVIAAVSLPTGAAGLSTHGIDPFIKFPWSRQLNPAWSVGGMQSLFYQTKSGHRDLMWEPAFYLERTITRRSDAFVEYGGDFPHGDVSRQVIHFGTSWRFTPKQQIDFHFGFGLSSGAPRSFVAAGYSFQIDHLFRALRKCEGSLSRND